jgi:DNA-binding IclR family transcriptional regulator
VPDGRDQIGMRLCTDALAPGHRDLHSLALPSMQDLHETTYEVVQLATRGGSSISRRRTLAAAQASGLHRRNRAGLSRRDWLKRRKESQRWTPAPALFAIG